MVSFQIGRYRFSIAQMKSPQSTDQSSSTGQEIDMNARTISISILAAALMASTSGAYAAQGLDQITLLGFTMSVPHIASRAECQVNMTRDCKTRQHVNCTFGGLVTPKQGARQRTTILRSGKRFGLYLRE